jgi:photosystem II stability/assembly factor-like uncharacterized protein
VKSTWGGVKSAKAVVAVLALAVGIAAGGCGGSVQATAQYGPPPAPVAGVHAWAVGEPGTVLVTADGGASWTRRSLDLPERGVDVVFTDARNGWVVTDGGAVLSTGDGGAGWSIRYRAAIALDAVAATDGTHVWVLGNDQGGLGAAVLRSTNGGNSWRRSSFGDAQLADVAFPDARHGVLIALDRIWTTGDGGRTWVLRRRLGMTVLTGVACSDRRTAWAVGWGTQDGAPLAFETSDGGVTWTRRLIDVPKPATGDLQCEQVVCSDATHLWVTCSAGVLASVDAGRTWALQTVPAGEPAGIAAADVRHLLATTNGQPILATADGGATWRAFGGEHFLTQPLLAVAAAAAGQ